jgi:nucleotide-binding universal stress UspA family protein
MLHDVKILAVVNEKWGDVLCLQRLSKKFRGTIHLLYVKDIEPHPAEVLVGLEKRSGEIREKGMEILSRIAKKAKSLGFDVGVFGVHCGIAAERL